MFKHFLYINHFLLPVPLMHHFLLPVSLMHHFLLPVSLMHHFLLPVSLMHHFLYLQWPGRVELNNGESVLI